jgi:hypothetical protein
VTFIEKRWNLLSCVTLRVDGAGGGDVARASQQRHGRARPNIHEVRDAARTRNEMVTSVLARALQFLPSVPAFTLRTRTRRIKGAKISLANQELSIC